MNQRVKYLQQVIFGIGAVVVGVFIYLHGTNIYQQTANLFAVSDNATSTVTISAEKFAQLEATKQSQVGRADASGTTTSQLSNDKSNLLANVVGRPPQSPYDTLVIDTGRSDGVHLEAGVWWPPGVYLGEVVELDQHSSVVELLSSPGVEHSARAAGLPLTTTGRGGDAFYGEVPAENPLLVGTTVFSDEYELPIGVVAATENLPTTNLQAVYITRFVSSSVIEDVYVEQE